MRRVTRQFWWTKHFSCMISSFVLHQTVWGVSPASFDGQNIWTAWLVLSCYIKLFEACHSSVLVDNTLSRVVISFELLSISLSAQYEFAITQNFTCTLALHAHSLSVQITSISHLSFMKLHVPDKFSSFNHVYINQPNIIGMIELSVIFYM